MIDRTWRHMAQSVDVDRFSDAYLCKRVCPGLRNAEGRQPTPTELRNACALARAKEDRDG